MDALELLHRRVSCPVLSAPAPTAEQLQNIYQAALRAPDHGAMRPWRFLTIQGEGVVELGQLFLQAALTDDPDLEEKRRDKLLSMPQRAPLIIVVIATLEANPKIPEVEQTVSAGCAAQNILHAAHAQGLGAMWRTGDMAYHPHVRTGLGLQASEQLIGYIYLGQAKKLRQPPVHEMTDFVQAWPA